MINKPSITEQLPTFSAGIVLLAAGSSSRLGQPKQLLQYQGRTLLSHAIDTAVATGASPLVVVVPPNEQLITREVTTTGVVVAINEGWQEGMAASIRCGLQQLLAINPQLQAVMLMVCDQPFVSQALLLQLWQQYCSTGKPIIASSYRQTAGTPALFDHSIFGSLLALKGDTGARKILRAHPELVQMVDFPLGEVDIDTLQDYERLGRG